MNDLFYIALIGSPIFGVLAFRLVREFVEWNENRKDFNRLKNIKK